MRLIATLPRPLTDVLVLAFEAVGLVAFRALRDEARELFADDPALVARIDPLFGDLLVDEVGHVHYLRSRLGPSRLAFARALLPAVERALFDDNHEIRILLERRGALAGIEDVDVDAIVAAEPERLALEAA